MNEHALRPGFMAAAAVALAGVLIVLLPQHAASIARLAVVTLAASAGLYALAVHAPAAWWRSPFDRHADDAPRARSADEVEWIRSTLNARRQPVANGPDLPPQTLRFLQPLIRAALERHGVEADHLAPRTRAVLDARPLDHAPWYRTHGPDGRAVADVVHSILDELDRLDGPARSEAHHDPRTRTAP
ncbi:MAG TPA: hypothetical protein VFZ93_11790 [Albitalea sp.]